MSAHVTLNELELQIEEAGKNLLQQLPDSADELLICLSKLEDFLIKVAQAPSQSMQGALLPSMKALISDKIFGYSDKKVNLSVISCIHEITRITAPDAPYNDEQMKAIFEKTVEAFERLADESGFFYDKAVSIVDNIARVRSCLMMLDLECDAAVVEMFRRFLKVIRPNHPNNVLLSIEAILIMMIEESEEISMDLLRPLLDSVRKENEACGHISWTLGEKVLLECSAKLKPYVKKGVESKVIRLDEFAEVVTSICQNEPEANRHENLNGSRGKQEEEKLGVKKDAAEPCFDEPKVLAPKEASAQSISKMADDTVNPEIGSDSQPAPSTKTQKKEKSKPFKKETSAKQQSVCTKKTVKSNDSGGNSEPNNLEIVDEVKPDIDPDSVPRKRGRKPNSLMNPDEGYDNTWICGKKKVAKSSRKRKSSDKDIDCSSTEHRASKRVSSPTKREKVIDSPPKPENVNDSPSKTEKMSEAPVSEPETSKNADAGSSVPSSQVPLDGSQKKRGRPKKNSTVDPRASSHLLSESREKSCVNKFDDTPVPARDCLMTDSHYTKDLGVKCQESSRKTSVNVKTDEKTSISSADMDENEPQVQKVARRKAKIGVNLKKVLAEASASKDDIDQASPRSSNMGGNPLQETPQMEAKGKVIAGKTPMAVELGEQLVGRRINVWWPMDKIFYKGVIKSYDSAKKKHTVLYLDGDQETLNLRKQRWQLIDDAVSSDSDRGLNVQKQDVESITPLKKKRKTVSEPSKKANSLSSSKSSGSILKSVKSSGRPVGNSALEKSLMDDDDEDTVSEDEPSQAYIVKKSVGKMKPKKSKKAVQPPKRIRSKVDNAKADKSERGAGTKNKVH